MELKGIKYEVFDGIKHIRTTKVTGSDGKIYHEYKSVKFGTPSVVYVSEETGERVTGDMVVALYKQCKVEGGLTPEGGRDESGAYLK